MKNLLTFLLFTSSLLCFHSCLKLNNCNRVYHFDIPVSVSPALDTLKIGETFTFEISMEHFVIDSFTNTEVDILGHDFEPFFAIYKIDTSAYNITEDFISFKEDNGELVPSQIFSLGQSRIFMENQMDRRYAKINFTVHREGTYNIAVGSRRSTLTEDVNLGDPDCSERIDINYTMNNGADNNYDIYISDSVPSESIIELNDLEGYNKTAGFTFRVVE